MGDNDAPPQPSSGYRWAVVAMLWFVCFFNYADRQAIFATFPLLETEFGFDKEELGLIASAFMWVYAAGAPFAGVICDRYRRKTLILGGCFFWSLVTVTTGWCSRLWQFVTVRALEGFGETFYFPASMSLVSDYHGRDTRSRAMAWHQSSVYVGTIMGSWLGALLAEKYGWRTGFYIFGGAGMVLSVVLLAWLVEPRRGQSDGGETASALEKPPLRESLRDIFRTPTALVLMLAFVGANFVATIFLTWTPTFLVQKFHYDLATAGLNGTVFIHLASAVTVPVAGWTADRCARRWDGGRILPQALGLLGGSVFVMLVGATTDRVVLLASMAMFGVCKGFYDAGIFASLYDVIPARSRGTAAGIMNTVGWGGGALGPFLTGWYATHGPHDSEIANMSAFISSCWAVYVASGLLLLAAIGFRASRDVRAATAQD
ncbi:MAG: MFS transporter [Gemmataceae bacterium]|nr:MFS transporter [Gemmataceae bacterium]